MPHWKDENDAPRIAWGGGIAPPTVAVPLPTEPAPQGAGTHRWNGTGWETVPHGGVGLPLEPQGFTPRFRVDEHGKTVRVDPNTPLPPHPAVERCNRHGDCVAANAKWLAEHPGQRWIPANFHCHDDDCEDCFGR